MTMMTKKKNDITERKIRRKVFLRLLKKSIKPKNLIFLIIILSANTFAWFVYVKEVHTDINVKVRAWNVVLTNSESEVISTLNVDIKSAYPGMEEFLNETKVYNQGESKADFNYTILSINAFGNGYFLPGSDTVHSYDLNIYFPDNHVNQDIDKNKVFGAKVEIGTAEITKK